MGASLADQPGGGGRGRRWRRWAVLLAAVALVVLLADCFDTNEVDKLPLALQRVQPLWLPGDWYLNQPQPHQGLFLELTGRLVRQVGFGAGALLIRLAGYGLWCAGALAVAEQLGLSLPWLLAGLALWLPRQGMVAGEWMLGSAEPKTFAYALLLLAFVSWRRGRPAWAGLMAGLAGSAHVLVGGYGALGLAGLALLQSGRSRWRWLARALPTAALGAWALYGPVLGRLRGLGPAGAPPPWGLSAAWLYGPFRHPHHLLPSSWGGGWLAALAVLLAWGLLGRWLAVALPGPALPANHRQACRHLWLWAGLALVPFGLGVLVSLLDPTGPLLQVYPFRLADTLVPLTVVLLGARLLQALAASRPGLVPLRRWGAGAVALVLALAAVISSRGVVLRPWRAFAPPPEKAALYGAVLARTPAGGRVLTPPGGFSDLALRTGRAQVVQFRQVPASLALLGDWARRLGALAGDGAVLGAGPGGAAAERRLVAAYGQLPPQALAALASRYGAVAVVTAAGQAGPPGWSAAVAGGPWQLWLPPPRQAGATPRPADGAPAAP
ncbi:MAG: hypothetical protein VKN13_05785 [Cyanobacteriota bacterium]|nr:hypothetical protein [Cyanobacteriota bacterium]